MKSFALRVGRAGGAQRLRDVVRADEAPPDGRRERAVRGDRLVDDVPLADVAGEVAHDRADVVAHDRQQLVAASSR